MEMKVTLQVKCMAMDEISLEHINKICGGSSWSILLYTEVSCKGNK